MPKKPLTKVFFVDDDKDILTVAKFALEKMPHVTMEYFLSGEEAIQHALKAPPDMMLLDVKMTPIDGIALFKTLQLIPTLSHIPIVFCTGRAQTIEQEEYRQLGVFDIILKPFDPIALPSQIQSIWDRYQEEE